MGTDLETSWKSDTDQSYSSHFLVAHLPDKQLIYFQEGIEAESVVRKSNSFTLALTMA
jgi:hypothetical protein